MCLLEVFPKSALVITTGAFLFPTALRDWWDFAPRSLTSHVAMIGSRSATWQAHQKLNTPKPASQRSAPGRGETVATADSKSAAPTCVQVRLLPPRQCEALWAGQFQYA